MTHLLYGDRLHLRPCQIDDLDFLHKLWNDPDIRRFLFDDRIISREEAQSFVDLSIKSFKSGYGLWLFFERQSDLVAGFAGLLDFSQEAPSLIFGTNPLLWGRDYATEAASVVLRYAFDTLKRDRVIADVDEPNAASIRVLEKLGMSPARRTIVNERPLLYYEIRDRVGN
ncbi:MAG: GNAT family N-acetyltransferase [Hydrococcus sp. C42_A2020_068]|uniref:GNAT family N-acetyltransferase n=1 Tax=Pleurocapsa sp. PCC 7327 TaxID=118163 RepID=UPI00029F868D|nr:acetyltransferase, ribosomal protein N-acetylase [Pleurocapsa sp. PCC 7327]MBF2019437.1 GNAT family N-acetyltransferase [Hydrococcus sp. C42_A2020_068]